MAASTLAEIAGRALRTDGGGPESIFARTVCAFSPVNGGSPASIS